MMIRLYEFLSSAVRVILAVISFFLILRILFLFFSANQSTPFVSWVLYVSSRIMSPFAGIAPNVPTGTGIVDIVAIVSLALYFLLGYILLSVFTALAEQQLVTGGHRAETVHYHDIDTDEEEYHHHRS